MIGKFFIVALTVIYLVGVLTGRLSKGPYTNGNMDTLIHGGLLTWGIALSIQYIREFVEILMKGKP